MSTRNTRLSKRSATTFDIRLRVKMTTKMYVNSTIPFASPAFMHAALSNLDLNNTGILQIQSTIENEVVKSSEFQLRFPGYLFFNSIVAMKCWRMHSKLSKSKKNKLKKSKSYDIKTEGDLVIDSKTERYRQEWFKQVTENGEKVEEGKEHYMVDKC